MNDQTDALYRCRREIEELTAENTMLRQSLEAFELGQMYELYAGKCKELSKLKQEHEQERQQMQRVIDTQRESFRKMEQELMEAKNGKA